MGYVDVQGIDNPTPGGVGRAAWADGVRANQEHFARNRPHFRAYNNAALSIPNNTQTAVTLNTESFDIGGMHSTSSSTSRGTVPADGAGKYASHGSGGWASNSVGIRRLQIGVNGLTVIASVRAEAATDNTPEFEVDSLLYAMVATDFQEMFAFQNSGGALNLAVSSNYSPVFSMFWEVL